MARQAAARSLLPRHTRWQALQQRLCGTNSSSISKLMGRRQLVPTRPLRPLCSASAAPGDSADDDASHTGSRAWRLRPPAVRSTPLRRYAAIKLRLFPSDVPAVQTPRCPTLQRRSRCRRH